MALLMSLRSPCCWLALPFKLSHWANLAELDQSQWSGAGPGSLKEPAKRSCTKNPQVKTRGYNSLNTSEADWPLQLFLHLLGNFFENSPKKSLSHQVSVLQCIALLQCFCHLKAAASKGWLALGRHKKWRQVKMDWMAKYVLSCCWCFKQTMRSKHFIINDKLDPTRKILLWKALKLPPGEHDHHLVENPLRLSWTQLPTQSGLCFTKGSWRSS